MDMEAIIIDTDKRLNSHEQVCAERYKGILDSFDKGSKRMQRSVAPPRGGNNIE